MLGGVFGLLALVVLLAASARAADTYCSELRVDVLDGRLKARGGVLGTGFGASTKYAVRVGNGRGRSLPTRVLDSKTPDWSERIVLPGTCVELPPHFPAVVGVDEVLKFRRAFGAMHPSGEYLLDSGENGLAVAVMQDNKAVLTGAFGQVLPCSEVEADDIHWAHHSLKSADGEEYVNIRVCLSVGPPGVPCAGPVSSTERLDYGFESLAMNGWAYNCDGTECTQAVFGAVCNTGLTCAGGRCCGADDPGCAQCDASGRCLARRELGASCREDDQCPSGPAGGGASGFCRGGRCCDPDAAQADSGSGGGGVLNCNACDDKGVCTHPVSAPGAICRENGDCEGFCLGGRCCGQYDAEAGCVSCGSDGRCNAHAEPGDVCADDRECGYSKQQFQWQSAIKVEDFRRCAAGHCCSGESTYSRHDCLSCSNTTGECDVVKPEFRGKAGAVCQSNSECRSSVCRPPPPPPMTPICFGFCDYEKFQSDPQVVDDIPSYMCPGMAQRPGRPYDRGDEMACIDVSIRADYGFCSPNNMFCLNGDAYNPAVFEGHGCTIGWWHESVNPTVDTTVAGNFGCYKVSKDESGSWTISKGDYNKDADTCNGAHLCADTGIYCDSCAPPPPPPPPPKCANLSQTYRISSDCSFDDECVAYSASQPHCVGAVADGNATDYRLVLGTCCRDPEGSKRADDFCTRRTQVHPTTTPTTTTHTTVPITTTTRASTTTMEASFRSTSSVLGYHIEPASAPAQTMSTGAIAGAAGGAAAAAILLGAAAVVWRRRRRTTHSYSVFAGEGSSAHANPVYEHDAPDSNEFGRVGEMQQHGPTTGDGSASVC
eukprot:UC1_evm1s1529